MRTLTTNDINDILKNICDSHALVNEFGVGPTYNDDLFGDNKYQLVWLEYVNSSMNINEQNRFNTLTYNINLYCFDKINLGENNYNDIINDTLYTLQTIVSTLQQFETFRQLNVRISDNVNFTPMYEVTNTNVNGWVANISIIQPMVIGICNSPIDTNKLKLEFNTNKNIKFK